MLDIVILEKATRGEEISCLYVFQIFFVSVCSCNLCLFCLFFFLSFFLSSSSSSSSASLVFQHLYFLYGYNVWSTSKSLFVVN